MGRRILVIDDNMTNMKLMRVLLELAGFEVDSAGDAKTAREAVDRQRPALILMDLQLPDLDGYALTRKFRQRPDLQGIPIIAVTASAMRGDEQRAIDAGCDGYLTKPIDTRSFSGSVARYLPPVEQAG